MKKVLVKDLIPYANNTRTHSDEQINKICASIKEFGWTTPILIGRSNGIIAGHGRILAAQKLGITEVPAIDLSHLSAAQKRAYIITDNQLALESGWDDKMLEIEINAIKQDGFDMSILGFDDKFLSNFFDDISEKQQLTDPDAIPEEPKEPISKIGDIWVLNEHRVACGDSLDVNVINRLLQNKKADMVFTDPPYLMDFKGAIDEQGNRKRADKHTAIINDKLSKSEGAIFLRKITDMIRLQCQGAWYISFYRLGIDWMMNALTDTGLKWRNLIIWKKNHFNLSNSDYKSIYEPIIYGWQSDYEPMLYGWNLDHNFEGPKNETDIMDISVPSVWEINRSKVNALHPTMKPVALIERAILNSSKKGDTVLDLFGGSGTTLIAAEITNRVARLCELEPKYVDVIIRRWEEFTGKKAILESNSMLGGGKLKTPIKTTDCVLFIDEEMARLIIVWGRTDVTTQDDDIILLPHLNTSYSPKKLAYTLNSTTSQIKKLVNQAIAVGIIIDNGRISDLAQKCVNGIIAKKANEFK
jgi:DNA modification methylase